MKILDRKFLDVNTNSCHAATIAFYNEKSDPVFAWFGGTMEGTPDSSIYMQLGLNGKSGKVFGGRFAHWNPILFMFDKRLLLAYKVGEYCDRWQTFIREVSPSDSDDKIEEVLPAGLNFCVKTKPIIIGNMIYCGSSVETVFDWSSYIEAYSLKDGINYVNRSNPISTPKIEVDTPMRRSRFDQSITFVKTLTKGLIQPSIWMSDDDKVMNAYMRSSTGLNYIYYSRSSYESGFMYWSKPEPTGLLNPNSGIDTVRFNNKIYLVHNPSDSLRNPLVLSRVSDNHEVLDQIVIRDSVKLSDTTNSQELSYPYMVENDGKLHIVYTYGRSKIEYVEVKV